MNVKKLQGGYAVLYDSRIDILVSLKLESRAYSTINLLYRMLAIR